MSEIFTFLLPYEQDASVAWSLLIWHWAEHHALVSTLESLCMERVLEIDARHTHQHATISHSRFFILGKLNHSIPTTTIKARMIGCNTLTPSADAIAPIANGNTVPPVPPIAIANPILLT